MSAYATRATQQDDPGQEAEDAQLYRAVLHELIHIGTDLARLTHQHAVAHAQAALQGAFPATPPQDHAADFDRIARAIRRCIALARSLRDPPPPARDPARLQPAAPTPTVLKAGATQHPSATPGRNGGTDTPSTEPRDRPDAPDRDRDVTTRPVADVIAEICRDLGLDTQPGVHLRQARPPADTDQLCAAAPGSTATSATCQSGPRPQAPGPGAAQRPSGPAEKRADQPAPVHHGRTLPDDPAGAVAMVLRRSARARGRWHPSPYRLAAS